MSNLVQSQPPGASVQVRFKLASINLGNFVHFLDVVFSLPPDHILRSRDALEQLHCVCAFRILNELEMCFVQDKDACLCAADHI